MKTILKHTALAATLAAGFIAIQTGHAEPAANETTTQQRTVGAFSALELAGPYRVLVRAQGKPSVELSGERKLLDDIETVVRGDTLVVRPVSRSGFHFSIGKRRDTVTVSITASMLKSLKMSGSGDVKLEQLGGDRFTLQADGPGDLSASGAVRELAVRSSGSGDLDLHQVKAASVDLSMAGPGDVRLAGVGNELVANVSGSGDLQADDLHVAHATARMSGPGDVTLSGESADLHAEVSGSGDLDASKLKVRTALVKNHGPGEIALATVSDTLDAHLSGSGDLSATMAGKRLQLTMSGPGTAHVDGSVDLVQAQLSGSGDLEARRLVAGRADIAASGPGSAAVKVEPKGDKRGAAPERAELLLVYRNGTRHTAE